MSAANTPQVTRSQVEQFLKSCIDLMTSDATREMLKDSSSGRPGATLVEIQKGVWDTVGVPTQAGRMAVASIEKLFPNDFEALVALRQEFAKTIDRVYLQCLEDRRPSVLEKKAPMTRAVVLEFLEACNVKLDVFEVRERLREHIKNAGSMPDAAINEVHSESMELLGFDREHGQRCFENFGKQKKFEQDRELAMSYARWRSKTSSVCFELLNEHRKAGGELHVTEEVKAELMQLQAKEELEAMSFDERNDMLEKNAKKVNVFRNLPDEARKRYLERLSEEEKMELAKSEILMMTLVERKANMLQRSVE
eukprot:gnl/TRDRNA2_/TRDRNA2_44420_c0_seq1.p1 gnl/TRDRNA2_/TRDRNA2_44420_c0~~gnl/TRDRNA2_/TRDRNA2_44420_c0_seq1.p1  ORF type:complete len:309 (+),score=69.80 gnl/TRDRNA2_/TRDRNA2_44420_c0_seq1:60-986(+)